MFPLVIVEIRHDESYEVRLGAVVVARSDGRVAPGALPTIESVGTVASERVVLLRWRGPSQGCLDYGYSFVTLHADGTFARASIQTSPSSARKSFSPDGAFVPARSWTYENGHVR